jgi:two-component system sensor histidine kinase VanS
MGDTAERDVRLELDLAPSAVDGDPVLLEHLVTNLLVNAHRHNLVADGVVWLRTRSAPGNPTLEVENSGALLDPAVVPTLVEPFVRGLGRVRSTDGRTGNGLGLSIVASIARAHGATLELRARRMGGLVATVTFPTPRPRPLAVAECVRERVPVERHG